MSDAFGRIVSSVFVVLAVCYFLITARAMEQENTFQTYLNSAVVEFVDNAKSSGKITAESYEELCYKIDSVIPLANLEITHQAAYAAIDEGGNVNVHYYSFVKDEILPVIYNGSGEYNMHNGDYLKVTVYNTEPTLATRLMHLFSQNQRSGNTSLYVTYSGGIANCPQ